MNFLVERPTPGREPDPHNRKAGTLLALLPLELEVADEPEPRGASYESSCDCGIVYRLTDDAMSWLSKRGLIVRKIQSNITVCPCMGRVI